MLSTQVHLFKQLFFFSFLLLPLYLTTIVAVYICYDNCCNLYIYLSTIVILPKLCRYFSISTPGSFSEIKCCVEICYARNHV